jgi:alpha-glucosidase
MIVAPVTKPVDKDTQLAQESVWVPQGEWIEQPTGKHFTGPTTVQRRFAINQIPVYLRAGAIVPMQPPVRYTGEKPVDPLILQIEPLADNTKSTYSVYDDASKGEDYKRGACTWTDVEAKQSGDDFTVGIAPSRGSYAGMPRVRGYEIRLPGDWPPETVTVNGTRVGFAMHSEGAHWHYEGNTLTTTIVTPRYPVTERVTIRVHHAAGSLASRARLDGFAGAETRLRAAYDALNSEWPFTWTPNPLIDAWQTGDRLSYKPQTAKEEMARFPNLYAQGMQTVQELSKEANMPDDRLVQLLMKNRGRDTNVERAREYRRTLSKALALLSDGKP